MGSVCASCFGSKADNYSEVGLELAELDDRYTLVVVLGERSVGRTSLLNALQSVRNANPLGDEDESNPQGDSDDKIIVVENGRKNTTHFWFKIPKEEELDDYHLHQRCRAMLIMFDITDRKTFDQIMKWHRIAASTYDSRTFLIGNKVDLADSREVPLQSAQLIADRYEMNYMEVSALTKRGIPELLGAITAAVAGPAKARQ